MANLLKSALARLTDTGTDPQPVHFHIEHGGRTVICEDVACGYPRLDARDGRTVRWHARGDMRWPIQPG